MVTAVANIFNRRGIQLEIDLCMKAQDHDVLRIASAINVILDHRLELRTLAMVTQCHLCAIAATSMRAPIDSFATCTVVRAG